MEGKTKKEQTTRSREAHIKTMTICLSINSLVDLLEKCFFAVVGLRVSDFSPSSPRKVIK